MMEILRGSPALSAFRINKLSVSASVLYNRTPVSPPPWVHRKLRRREDFMMEILRGSPALSAFRINKL
ncbi:hypothetical protein VS883_28150, partial [Escherichia coli]